MIPINFNVHQLFRSECYSFLHYVSTCDHVQPAIHQLQQIVSGAPQLRLVRQCAMGFYTLSQDSEFKHVVDMLDPMRDLPAIVINNISGSIGCCLWKASDHDGKKGVKTHHCPSSRM